MKVHIIGAQLSGSNSRSWELAVRNPREHKRVPFLVGLVARGGVHTGSRRAAIYGQQKAGKCLRCDYMR